MKKLAESVLLQSVFAGVFLVLGLLLLGVSVHLFITYSVVYWFFAVVCPLSFIAALMFGDNAKSLKAGTGIKWS